MSRARKELDQALKELLDSCGIPNTPKYHLYFQPPANVHMSYPCIVYHLSNINSRYADDKRYLKNKSYDVTVIDKSPDSKLAEALMDSFSYCYFSRSYAADGLNHYAFVLYY